MKKVFTLLFLSIGLLAFAQVEKFKIEKQNDSIPEEKPRKEPVDNPERPLFVTANLTYWPRLYTHNFKERFNTINSFIAARPVAYAGFGFSGYEMPVNRTSTWTSQIFLNEVISQTIRINDSIPAKLKGFAFTLGFGKSLYTKNRNLGISLYFISFSTGRLVLQNDIMGKQKNQFFSPMISLEPKLIIKRVSLSLMVSYEHDISKARWTKIGKNTFEHFEGFDQSCVSGFISLGYRLRSAR